MSFLLNVWKALYSMRKIKPEILLQERRSSYRIPCNLKGTCSFRNHQARPLVITDFGQFGIQICIDSKLQEGDCVIVSPMRGIGYFESSRYAARDIYMTVSWCRKKDKEYIAGLRYNDSKMNMRSSWIAQLYKNYGCDRGDTFCKRKTVRISSRRTLVYKILANKGTFRGRVLDISSQGILIEMEQGAKRGEIYRFRVGPYESLNPLIFEGAIVHQRYDRDRRKWVAGIHFYIPDAQQERILGQYITTFYLEKKTEELRQSV